MTQDERGKLMFLIRSLSMKNQRAILDFLDRETAAFVLAAGNAEHEHALRLEEEERETRTRAALKIALVALESVTGCVPKWKAKAFDVPSILTRGLAALAAYGEREGAENHE